MRRSTEQRVDMGPTRRSTILFCDHTVSMSGGEIALSHLIRALDKDRFEPVALLFAEGPLNARLRDMGVEVHALDLDASVADVRKDTLKGGGLVRQLLQPSTPGFIAKLRRFMVDRHVDLVHTNSLKSDLLAGTAARLARRPLVWHIRDRIADDYLPAAAAKAFRTACRILPHRLIANSHATLETLRLPSAADTRGVVVHDGFPPTSEPIAPYDWAQPVIGLVGRLSPWKGQHIFLDAAAIVRRSAPNARFLIIGAALFDEREYEAQIREQCRRLGLDDLVTFTGFTEDVLGAYRRLTILVHASTVPEPFGQVVLEGMMEARPVIATRGGGVTEIVLDGRTGVLVPMSDAQAMAAAILELLADPNRAEALGRAARARAIDCFSIDRTARGVEAVYDSLLRSAC